MGRYFSGDIDGKFWFGVQSSNAADRFGVTGYQPETLTYNFESENLVEVESEIKNIEESLGDKLAIIDEFFKQNNGYTNKMLLECGISNEEIKEYADLNLGRQIRDEIKKNGQCYFEAEC